MIKDDHERTLYPGLSSQLYNLVWSGSTLRLQLAHDNTRLGPSGKVISSPFSSASKLGPCALAGSVKLMRRPKMAGYAWRITSFAMVRTTSASMRKVAVSDQSRTETAIVRPPREKVSVSMRVNGHGPAMHEILAFRNSCPSPASSLMPSIDARHFPSGEHG